MDSDFLLKIQQNFNEANYERIEKAYYFAMRAHEGQKRQSGEDYFIHPSAVAEILVDLGLDTDTIIAALLHDVIEDTKRSAEDLEMAFGHEVVMLVNGVTKLNKLNFKSKEEEQAENLRRMFLAMSNDIRVIIIKLADRLHNMRTLSYKTEESQIRIATETLDIYAPIAARLGIANVKGELEDLSLRYLHPDDYYYIAEKVAQKKIERQNDVDSLSKELKIMLDELEIKGDINGRPKHFYSIYRKLQSGKTFEQIYDLIALRVIVDDVKDCYAVLGAIHTKWKPLPGRFKDYISVPKSNMYQSLHTTVLTSFGSPFEIQIRTREMHVIAEFGIAAHWKYKQGNASGVPNSFDDNKLSWIRSVMELQNEVSDSKEYLDSLKVDLYADQVFVFTPTGDVFNLPNGSTGIDFAYAVHSQVGNKCVGIKLNSRMVPITTKLTNGDVVEAITSNNSKGPSRDWLKFVITPSAKSKIRSFFKKEMKEENVKKGREALEKECKHKGYALADITNSNAAKESVQNKFNLATWDEVVAMIGYGEISALQVVNKLEETYLAEHPEARAESEIAIKTPSANKQQDRGIIVKGCSGMKIRFSHCCTPLPGDAIIGYVSRSRGVTIHRADCPNCKNLEAERLIEAEWPTNSNEKFVAGLNVYAWDKIGLVVEVATTLTNMKIAITDISAKKEKNGMAIVNLAVEVANIDILDSVISKLKGLKGVEDVQRNKN
ncbi:MAG: bifunctional (p)ppGpp synthetase/guanosine-3',5'-bis(diphosphate) 3'-pyrophosphohydrolase [Clostridia bacterium]